MKKLISLLVVLLASACFSQLRAEEPPTEQGAERPYSSIPCQAPGRHDLTSAVKRQTMWTTRLRFNRDNAWGHIRVDVAGAVKPAWTCHPTFNATLLLPESGCVTLRTDEGGADALATANVAVTDEVRWDVRLNGASCHQANAGTAERAWIILSFNQATNESKAPRTDEVGGTDYWFPVSLEYKL